MEEAAIQKRMDIGSDIMYLTRPVKLRRRKKLPAKPQANDMALRMISLVSGVSLGASRIAQRPGSATGPYHRGSRIPTPLPSVPSGSWPLFGRVTLQGDTRAATERTLERGPMVAESSGMAVEANHHCLHRSEGSPVSYGGGRRAKTPERRKGRLTVAGYHCGPVA